MEIEFDPLKRQQTLDERGLDFADAPQIFEGRTLSFEDDRHDYGEVRIVTFGFLKSRLMSKQNSKSRLDPADDAPVLTRERAARAQVAEGARIIREADPPLKRGRGRPAMAAEDRKTQLSMRLSPRVIEAMRASGPGWMRRAEDALRREFSRKRA